jgi:hypothetical protein
VCEAGGGRGVEGGEAKLPGSSPQACRILSRAKATEVRGLGNARARLEEGRQFRGEEVINEPRPRH